MEENRNTPYRRWEVIHGVVLCLNRWKVMFYPGNVSYAQWLCPIGCKKLGNKRDSSALEETDKTSLSQSSIHWSIMLSDTMGWEWCLILWSFSNDPSLITRKHQWWATEIPDQQSSSLTELSKTRKEMSQCHGHKGPGETWWLALMVNAAWQRRIELIFREE